MDPATAVLRNNRSQFNTPSSARPSNGFGRRRLPSIGEAPDSSHRDLLTAVTKSSADPYAKIKPIEVTEQMHRAMEMPRASTASPRLTTKGHPPPSPSPAAVAALMEGPRRRNGSRSRIPEGLDLSLPSLGDSVTDELTSPEQSGNSAVRYHWPSRRRAPGSVASSATSANSSVIKGHGHSHGQAHRGHQQGKSLDDYIHSLDVVQGGTRERSRDGRAHARESSRTRRGEREASRDRGRAASRGYTPKGGKRSPKSPVPMSPEDLINLSTPREDLEFSRHAEARRRMIDDGLEQPSTVKKIRHGSRTRASSRGHSRNGRASSRTRSPDRNAPIALDLRGRSNTREGSGNRSPSSPVPMSAGPQHYYGSDDEEDYRQALEAKEQFRRRNGRSSSRNGRENPASPASTRSGAWSTRDGRGTARAASETTERRRKVNAPMPTPAPMQLVTDSSGDLKVIKDERQLKKEAAARELEERRKSLARRPAAPPIPHPDELSPAPTRGMPTLAELPSTVFVPMSERDLPSRSASVDPSAGRSMYANRNGPHIGLPATPKAMRLVLESDSSRIQHIPVPPIPSTFAQASPQMVLHSNQTSPKRSPRKLEPEQPEIEPPLKSPAMLLPSTVYTPPPSGANRPLIQRSMSAPPQDLVMPQGTLRGLTYGHQANRPSLGGDAANLDAMNGRRPSYDAVVSPRSGGRRPSHDANIPPPPPPPPAPPMLKELQHLATPPPPPPAPLPHLAMANSPKPIVYGSGAQIEIVHDDDQPQQQTIIVPVPAQEATVPIISPPAPPSSRNGHQRGRSSVDNSIGARISRATERMRSASRNRTVGSRDINRTKSPEMIPGGVAPYESVQMPPMQMQHQHQQGPPPSLNFAMRAAVEQQAQAHAQQQQQLQLQQQQQQQAQAVAAANDYRTGLHQSEMI